MGPFESERSAMSDERLRELERRWKETDSVEDEAAYLLERVRIGELTQERLELAAYCGQEASRLALGPKEHDLPGDLEEWVLGLARWGCTACGIAALGVAELVRERWAWPWDERLDVALQAAADWVTCPCERHRSLAKQATLDATWARASYEDPRASQAAHALSWACAVASRSQQPVEDVALDAVRTVRSALDVIDAGEVEQAAQRVLIEKALAARGRPCNERRPASPTD